MTTTPLSAGAGSERGAYEWRDATWWPNPSAYAGTLATLQGLGVNTLYVDITRGVTLLQQASSALPAYEAAFSALVAEAGAIGIKVDAVGGDPTWATSHKAGPGQLLTVVAQLLAANPGTALHGVQFDVEPWGLRAWRYHRGAYARNWVQFVQSTGATWQRLGLPGRLGFTAPYWFDGVTGGVPKVTVNGVTGFPFQLALTALAPLQSTVLNVMAYRNATSGPNGSIALFTGNLNAASAAASQTKLLLGQETGASSPASTTFLGTSCDALTTAANQIEATFAAAASYQGIAIDNVESLKALCPSPS
jgi:hypothetical protein